MAYNSGGNQSPFVSSVSPAAISAPGNTTFTVDGALFSPSMTVDVPSGLGSLVSVTITQPTSTTSRAVIVINVAAISGLANYDVTFSNGGESSSNSIAQIQTNDFTVAGLLQDSQDVHLSAEMASSVGDGNLVPSVNMVDGSGGSVTVSRTSTSKQYTYRASAVNGQPGLEGGSGQRGGLKQSSGGPSSPGVFVSPKDTSFFVAMCWKPLAGATGQTMGSWMGTDGYGINFKDDDNEIAYLYFNGVDTGAEPYVNNDTEGVRYLFMYGGGGSVVTVEEPTTGLNFTRTITGTNTPTYVTGNLEIVNNYSAYFLEYIKLDYVPAASERSNLLSFWQDKYGV